MSLKDAIQEQLAKYHHWLRDKTILEPLENQWIKITTPYLDRHNDYLQLYAKMEEGRFILSDDSYIINDLISSGCPLNSSRRKDLLKGILAGFGVQLNNEELVIHATAENFPVKKHNLIQAMLAVNDLFYCASSHVSNLFLEDVSAWLDLCQIRYTPRLRFAGKSGYDHEFDFVIPKSLAQPERIIQTINNPKKQSAESLLMKWLDTRDTRPRESKMIAVLNDSSSPVSASVLEALQNYDLTPVIWSKRDDAKTLLAA